MTHRFPFTPDEPVSKAMERGNLLTDLFCNNMLNGRPPFMGIAQFIEEPNNG